MRRGAALALVIVAVIVLVGIVWWRVARPAPAEGEPESGPTIIAVRVAPIVQTTLRGYVPAWGTVEPQQATTSQPPASARIATPVAGIVAQASCAEGQRVAMGTVLFRLDSRVADVAVQKARQAVQYAEQGFARQQRLGAGEATSQRLFMEAEQNLTVARNELANAEAQRALLVILSPLAGTLVRVSARPGDAVDPTSVLAEVIDLDRLVISATVRSVDVPRLRIGQSVEVSIGSQGTPASTSQVVSQRSALVFIASQVDSKTDAVLVRALVPMGVGLRAGQFVNLRIVSEEHRDRLAVPVESVVTDADGSTIAVVTGDTAVKRAVKTGLRDGNLVEVEGDGLKAGMTVVAAGAYGLPKETKVRVIRP
ncbi:MAG: efflux RND transporter periplasmic adaptor subunit [Acidobacteria bacterium]|nr:efflux RND transporter periplasmic adaptor subunit [Acidobacteriota bacterium]